MKGHRRAAVGLMALLALEMSVGAYGFSGRLDLLHDVTAARLIAADFETPAQTRALTRVLTWLERTQATLSSEIHSGVRAGVLYARAYPDLALLNGLDEPANGSPGYRTDIETMASSNEAIYVTLPESEKPAARRILDRADSLLSQVVESNDWAGIIAELRLYERAARLEEKFVRRYGP